MHIFAKTEVLRCEEDALKGGVLAKRGVLQVIKSSIKVIR